MHFCEKFKCNINLTQVLHTLNAFLVYCHTFRNRTFYFQLEEPAFDLNLRGSLIYETNQKFYANLLGALVCLRLRGLSYQSLIRHQIN